MHCMKLLGQRLMARDFDRQVTEVQVCAVIINLDRLQLNLIKASDFGVHLSGLEDEPLPRAKQHGGDLLIF